MNGAESLLRAARAAGLETCFANPGTTELPLVRALDRVAGIRAVLGLFEGVCTGAADGYGRMSRHPALTLLHLGPGLANGLANLHNARRAGTPIVNLVGEQATWHRACDAPLTSDIPSMAALVSGWVRTATSSQALAGDVADAIAAAAAGRVATLILPSDCQQGPGTELVSLPPLPSPDRVADHAVEAAAKALSSPGPAALLLGGPALSEAALRAAARVAMATGSRLVVETFPARLERGRGLPDLQRLPYRPQQARATFEGTERVVLVGAREPVTFFGYPGQPISILPETAVALTLAAAPQDANEDATDALVRLADRLGAPTEPMGLAVPPPPVRPSGSLTLESLAAAIAACQPEGAIVVDESVSSGFDYFPVAAGSSRHTYLCHLGGALGQGLPLAAGAAVACPGRPVIAFQADGSGMYTLQALWTCAREDLDVTTLICANHKYRILQLELADTPEHEPGPVGASLLDLSHPNLDWVRLAEGMGVPARRVTTADELVDALGWALADPGPHLIEAIL
jgi:acetolactate synthase I/II/III large subunit